MDEKKHVPLNEEMLNGVSGGAEIRHYEWLDEKVAGIKCPACEYPVSMHGVEVLAADANKALVNFTCMDNCSYKWLMALTNN